MVRNITAGAGQTCGQTPDRAGLRSRLPTFTRSQLPEEGSPSAAGIKNLTASSGDTSDAGSVSVLGRSPGIGNGNVLQYSCLENSMDRGGWQATAHGVANSWT